MSLKQTFNFLSFVNTYIQFSQVLQFFFYILQVNFLYVVYYSYYIFYYEIKGIIIFYRIKYNSIVGDSKDTKKSTVLVRRNKRETWDPW